jgi:hypothetical protein
LYSPWRDNGQQPAVQALKDMPKQVRPQGGGTLPPPLPPEPSQPPTIEEIRNEAWNHPRPGGIISYNKDHAFPAYARNKGLGAPLGDTWDWRGLRIQQFVLGIVYATIGDWPGTTHIDW